MFYIDFTTPEGKTYRIDVEKNPVTYECPVCGEKTMCLFSHKQNPCESCYQREQEKEWAEMEDKTNKHIAEYLNRRYHSSLKSEDIKQFFTDADNAEDPHKYTEDFIRKLEENKPRKKICDSKLATGIKVIDDPKYKRVAGNRSSSH